MTSINDRVRGAELRVLQWLTRVVAAGLLLAFGAGPVSAEDAPPPPPILTPSEALFLPLKEQLQATSLPPFLKDTDLKLHFRSYYFNRTKPDL